MTSELSDDEAMAAEYVLGTLEAGERAAVEGRRGRDAAFDALIGQWEARLGPLAVATPDLLPPTGLYDAILRRLPPGSSGAPDGTVTLLRRQVRFWRNTAIGAGALAASLLVGVAAWQLLPQAAAQTYVAVLQQGAGAPAFVVSMDMAHRRMSVIPLAMTTPQGKSYELWMIGADKSAPRSMGVVDAGTARSRLPDMGAAALSEATYAVTLEPPGGSPTGRPSGTPLFVGKLQPSSL